MSVIRSLTRLVVGAALLGADELSARLQTWDQSEGAGQPSTPDETTLATAPPPAGEQRVVYLSDPTPSQQEIQDLRLRHALVGLVFDVQDSFGRGLGLADRATRLAGRAAEPFVSPLYNSRAMGPIRTRFDSLAERGAAEVERWIAIGEAETPQSRTVTSTAVVDGVDTVVDYLASDEKVQELIQSQSVGLIDEILEETRERAVSLDNLLEMLARNMLRKTPRSELPGPPPVVLNQAMPFRKVQGVMKRR